ncbi:MAG: NHL repeat-containing protein [Pseudomonadota bacterium]
MRVSLAPVLAGPQPLIETGAPRHLLDTSGPDIIIGGHLDPSGLAAPIQPRANTLFGPRGACLASPQGPLFVCDTGHHRLLIWKKRPTVELQPADFVIGQPNFESEGRNGREHPSGATLNVPTGVAAVDGVLAVADAWNHRVLIWHRYPETSNQPADVVLGQADFLSVEANRGADTPAADTLYWCYGVAIVDGRLLVADTGNRRVLIWDGIPTKSGAPADIVLGQHTTKIRDENAGGEAGAFGMRWPHGMTVANGLFCVSDAGNNRVMVWESFPPDSGKACDFVVGQPSFSGLDHNQARYYPTDATLNMPYGVASIGGQLAVADTANSRLVAFDASDLHMGAAAHWLTGQYGFADKGDNRWCPATRDSLCWPYNIAAQANTLVVADSGNNRVMLWRAAA